MELTLNPSRENTAPLRGILIRKPSPFDWAIAFQQLGLVLEEYQVYPLPGPIPNSVWGCLVVSQESFSPEAVGVYQLCQQVSPTLFIPEKSILIPSLTAEDKAQLFSDAVHLFHPEIGLANLGDPVRFEDLFEKPTEHHYAMRSHEPSVFIPQNISLYQVIPDTNEDVLHSLEQAVGTSDVSDQPLDLVEKARLKLYKLFLSEEEKNQLDVRKIPFMEGIEKLLGKGDHDEKDWSTKMQNDFADLDARNKKEFDQLLDLLKNNPEEGLKYAIPLDETGTSRGHSSHSSTYLFSKIWSSLSLASRPSTGGVGYISSNNQFHELNVQYQKTARELIEKGEYEKAAFVYLKLLKQHWTAAETLENGHLYRQAASIYLDYCNNKEKAAECLEKGNMTREAIRLYHELEKHEKVGDLSSQLNEKAEAMEAYRRATDNHLDKKRYVDASIIFRNKMNSPEEAQQALLTGWQRKRATDCLNLFFKYTDGEEELKKVIGEVRLDLSSASCRSFLKVLRRQQEGNPGLKGFILDTAYTVIAEHVNEDKQVLSVLQKFVPSNADLEKDISRYYVKK